MRDSSPSKSSAARYFDAARDVIGRLDVENTHALEGAAQAVAARVARGGRIYAFGAGHSGLVCQDVFYRAGGLKDLVCIFDERLMLDFDPVAETSHAEKREGQVLSALEPHALGKRDALIVVSTSGVNAAPVDAARHARARGTLVVAVTSSAYVNELASRHSSGQRLADAADHVLDNLAPYGDTVVDFPNGVSMGSTSTMAGAVLVQALVVSVREKCAELGVEMAVYVSGNIPGGMDRNLG